MRNYQIENLPQYFEEYKKSIKNPKKFWDKIADENLCGIRDGARS
jgi:acetyl-CoA synthetase